MGRPVVAAVAIAVALYLAVCALMFLVQRSLIYFPQPRGAGVEVSRQVIDRDGLPVVVTTAALSEPDAVLYFGGNAEDVSSSVGALRRAFPDQALYLMHYRGFGGSGGRPSEAALVDDARALYDLVAPKHRAITVIGRSLGSGVAIQLATERPVTRLVLVTPYNSLVDIASDLYPWLPVRWLLLDRFESWRFAPSVTAPTRVIVAERDAIVPIPSSDELLRHFGPGIATRVQVPGSDHINILDAPGFAAAVNDGTPARGGPPHSSTPGHFAS